MDMIVKFSIITIVTILFGTSMTTTTNIAWADPQVKVDSQSCSKDQKSVNVQFSWSGFSPDDDLELNVNGDQHFPLLSKKYDGTSDGSGSGEFLLSLPTSSKLILELNAAGSGGGARTGFSLSCVIVEEHKK